MIKFPSIDQFKNLIAEISCDTRYAGKDENGKVIYNNDPLPVLNFIGTAKVHGSNAGITYYKSTDKLIAQSRTRQLSLDHDNMGFYSYVFKNESYWKHLCWDLIKKTNYDSVTIFGEWCGPGIQSGVAVSKLPKKIFIIFSIRFKNNENDFWIDTTKLSKYLPECISNYNAYNITDFGTWNFEIDFNAPELIQNKLIELVQKIENECPVGKYFGISGIGEGIVISHNLGHKIYRAKIKGEKHSNSKVKTLAPIDEEAHKNAREFAETYVTESRLNQGIFWMKNELDLEPEIKNLGAFIKWIVGDIIKEESRNIAENELDVKKISREIGTIARTWFMKNYT